MAFWIGVESLLLASWGTTPGKWLLRICVSDMDGQKLTYKAALRRSFQVWFVGKAFAIPILDIITEIIAFDRLKEKKVTVWDEKQNLRVVHQPIGYIRGGVAAIIIIVIAIWSSI